MSSVPSIVKEITVEASQKRAFDVFTAGMRRWWPREHHIGTSPFEAAIVEPHAGGRWYTRGQAGDECNVGKVLVWEPPARVVLAWQLTADWTYDASFVTEVEVRFEVEGPRRTRVHLEHRNLERFGIKSVEMRAALDSIGGWDGSLDLFVKQAAKEEAGGEVS